MNAPLDQFLVISLSPIITNISLYGLIIVIIVICLHQSELGIVPSRLSILINSIYSTTLNQVKEQTEIEEYTPFFYSLFLFVLIGNLLANVPYGFALTSSVIVAIGWSVANWLAVTIQSLKVHKFKFFSRFIPEGTPGILVVILIIIEIISYSAQGISLGVRLFANIVAGHALLSILSSILYSIPTVLLIVPFSLFILLIGLEIAVSFIQAFVLVVLNISYLHKAFSLH